MKVETIVRSNNEVNELLGPWDILMVEGNTWWSLIFISLEEGSQGFFG